MRQQIVRTRITDLFGIRHPILCGGLMWLADANYAAAAANAGCLGFMTAKTFPDPGRWKEELEKAKQLANGNPLGVNLYISQRPEENAMLSGHADLALQAGVRSFETAAMPPADLVRQLKEGGAKVIHKVASVRHAVSAASKLDIDAVSVVGMECGGHPGLNMIGNMVQGVLAALRVDIPVVIGGGIGHGRQLAGALAFGAEGVVLGTRLLVADEIWSHDAVKQRVLQADETSSRLVLASMRNTYRVIDNETARAVAELEAAGVSDYESYREHVGGTLQREAYEEGDPEKGLLSMGQSAVFADRIEPLGAIIDRMMDEMDEAMRRVQSLRVARDAAAE
jgi:nitronate monooxygenase